MTIERKRTYIERLIALILGTILGFIGSPTRQTPKIRTFASSTADPNYVGVPFSGAGLARWHVSYRHDFDLRFRADATGALRSISTFICEGSGYAAGHGGTLQLDIYADDGSGLPTGPSLGSHTRVHPLQPGSSPPGKWANTSEVGYVGGNFFGELMLTPQPTVTANGVYHAVFTNPTGDGGNWYCIDGFGTRYKGGNREPQNLALIPSMDWGGLSRARPFLPGDGGTDPVNYTDNVWRDNTGYLGASGNPYFNSFTITPIASVNYVSGHSIGHGTIFRPLGVNPLQSPVDASSGSKQRQTFPAGSMHSGTVIGAGFPIIPVATGGTARINLRRLDNDAIVATGDVAYSLPPAMLPIGSPYCHFASNPTPVGGSINWDYAGYGEFAEPAVCDNNAIPVFATFTAPASVSSSIGYYVELTCPPSGACRYAVQGGTKVNNGAGYGYGFGPETQQPGEWERFSGGTWNNGGDKQSNVYVQYDGAPITTTTTTAASTTTTTVAPGAETVYPTQPSPVGSVNAGAAYAVETAQRITVSCNGSITGVRWYRTAADTGTNTVSIWRSGVLVAEGAADSPVSSGWVTTPLDGRLTVTAGDVLVVGVHHPQGAYATNVNGFTGRSISSLSGCLTSPASVGGALNGMYAYSSTPILPILSYAASEYYTSPVFFPTAVPTTTTTTTTTTSTTTTTAAPTTTTTLAPGTATFTEDFSSFVPSDATTRRRWALVDPEWQPREKGYIDFAGSGTWNANQYEAIPNNTGGTTVLTGAAVSAGVLTISNKPLPSSVAAGVRALADAQGQAGVATPTRYGAMVVSDRGYTNPTTGRAEEFLYGYWEMRAAFPDFTGNAARGIFPAWWFYAAQGEGNPQDKGRAEIDVFEIFGHALGRPMTATLHYGRNDGSLAYPPLEVHSTTIDPTSYHLYGFEWTASALRFYIDNVQVAEVTGTAATWFNTPMSMRMNVASDAPWFASDKRTDGSTADPARFQIDYIYGWNSKPAGYGTATSTTTTTTPTTTTTTTSTTTTTTTPTTTTTATTTTAPAGSRTVTLSAFADLNGDGVKGTGEPIFKRASYRVTRVSDGAVIATGLTTRASTAVTVPNGSYRVRWVLPSGIYPSTPGIVTLPSTGAAAVKVGACCGRAVG